MNGFDNITPDGYSPEHGGYVVDDGEGNLVVIA